MGRTVNFASSHGYFLLHHFDQVPHKTDFLIMASGSLLYLILLAYSLFALLTVLSRVHKELDDDDDEGKGLAFSSGTMFTWIGNWLFWAGYVRLAGTL